MEKRQNEGQRWYSVFDILTSNIECQNGIRLYRWGSRLGLYISHAFTHIQIHARNNKNNNNNGNNNVAFVANYVHIVYARHAPYCHYLWCLWQFWCWRFRLWMVYYSIMHCIYISDKSARTSHNIYEYILHLTPINSAMIFYDSNNEYQYIHYSTYASSSKWASNNNRIWDAMMVVLIFIY